MVGWLKTWAEGIIIAVIIGTIIEMIIPEGNNKKYVKTVIGIYIMFSIVSPIITRFTNKQVSFSIENYDTYYKQTNTYDELSKQFENSNELKLEELYIENLNEDIKQKMNNKGYTVNDIKLDITTEEGEQYGSITNMEIDLEVLEEHDNQELNNRINKVSIDKVKIKENEQTNTTVKDTNSIPESKELKEFLANEYGVDIGYIIIK